MGQTSSISWTDATWNIARGCTKIDSDCKYCYMYRGSLDSTRYNPLDIVRTKGVFNLPLTLKEPSKIFACSLTDFFHEAIDGYRAEAWDIIRKCPQHTFQILTKRPERIIEHLPADWGEGWDNVWLGTSIGSQEAETRVIDLLKVKAKIHFLSIEPMWGKVDLKNIKDRFGNVHNVLKSDTDLYRPNYIKWVVVGGESGNENGKYKYRPCELEWFDEIVHDCKINKVAVFVKQMGTYLSKQIGLSKLGDRHGTNIERFPENLQVRQFPV